MVKAIHLTEKPNQKAQNIYIEKKSKAVVAGKAFASSSKTCNLHQQGRSRAVMSQLQHHRGGGHVTIIISNRLGKAA